jgi:hypothetical protein
LDQGAQAGGTECGCNIGADTGANSVADNQDGGMFVVIAKHDVTTDIPRVLGRLR